MYYDNYMYIVPVLVDFSETFVLPWKHHKQAPPTPKKCFKT